jgi:hypothetical protein
VKLVLTFLLLVVASCSEPSPVTTIATPTTTANSAGATGWSTEQYQETVAYCTTLEQIEPASCPDLVNVHRDAGCTVEQAYYFIGEVALADVTDPDAFQELDARVEAECGS